MKISAKTRYAIKAVLELSMRSNLKVPVQIGEIAESQNMPKKFLLQILNRLKNAGLVKSTRGVSGGYSLQKNPEQIKLSDVVRAVDNNIISDITSLESAEGTKSDMVIMKIWDDINYELVKKLDNIDFGNLSLKLKNEELIYHI